MLQKFQRKGRKKYLPPSKYLYDNPWGGGSNTETWQIQSQTITQEVRPSAC